MIEISSEKQGELMEHAEKAYKHIGKMLECIEQMGEGRMGQREDDEWYIRRMNRDYMPYGNYGSRDDYPMGEMGERRGRSHYGNRYGGRDPYFY